MPYDPPDFTEDTEPIDDDTQQKLSAAEQRAFSAALSSIVTKTK